MDDGATASEGVDEATHRHLDLVLREWQATLEAMHRAADTLQRFRSGAVTTALVFAFGGFLVQRFVYLAEPEQLIVGLLPAAVLVGALVLDRLHYAPAVSELAERAQRFAAERAARRHGRFAALARTTGDEATKAEARAAAGYYLLPALVLVGLNLWGLLR